LADLINSETEAQRKQAVRVFDGSIGRKVKEWRASLIEAGSLIEVTIDFSEEDIPLGLLGRVSELVTKIIMELEKEIESTKLSERVRSGFEVAIIGAPNVGKSTLINALAGREAAITSKIAGTTRDVIEVRMDLNGLPVTFLDTAGLRETKNEVEILGIKRARDRAETADLRIFLTEEKPLKEFIVKQELDIEIASKGDLSGVGVSGLTGYGIPELIDLVSEKLTKMALGAGIATNERHRRAMIISVGTLKNCKKELQRDVVRSEIAAEELRSSVMALESMVGSVGVEDLLDEIFSNFCLGK
jgi:tRNA modification GTPase